MNTCLFLLFDSNSQGTHFNLYTRSLIFVADISVLWKLATLQHTCQNTCLSKGKHQFPDFLTLTNFLMLRKTSDFSNFLRCEKTSDFSKLFLEENLRIFKIFRREKTSDFSNFLVVKNFKIFKPFWREKLLIFQTFLRCEKLLIFHTF